MKKLKFLPMAFAAILIASCSDDDNTSAPVNEEEVITTAIVTLVPNGGGSAVTLTSRDLDGDGPNAPVITVSGNLSANTVYAGSIDLLNETLTPAESITEEIIAEAEDHQFFFNGNGLVSTTYGVPFDANSNPVGVNFTLTTTTAGNANFVVVLRHEPNKTAEGVASGDITNAGGHSDIEVSYPIVVQ